MCQRTLCPRPHRVPTTTPRFHRSRRLRSPRSRQRQRNDSQIKATPYPQAVGWGAAFLLTNEDRKTISREDNCRSKFCYRRRSRVRLPHHFRRPRRCRQRLPGRSTIPNPNSNYPWNRLQVQHYPAESATTTPSTSDVLIVPGWDCSPVTKSTTGMQNSANSPTWSGVYVPRPSRCARTLKSTGSTRCSPSSCVGPHPQKTTPHLISRRWPATFHSLPWNLYASSNATASASCSGAWPTSRQDNGYSSTQSKEAMTWRFGSMLLLFFCCACISCRHHEAVVRSFQQRTNSAAQIQMVDDVQLIYSVPQWLVNLSTEATPVTNRAVRSASRPAVSADSAFVPVLRVDAQQRTDVRLADTAQVARVVGVDRPPAFSLHKIISLVFSIVILGLVIRIISRLWPQ